MKNAINITIKLFVITVACAALLGVVYSITKEPIALQEAKAAVEARLAAFPEAADFKEMEDKDTEKPVTIPNDSIIKSAHDALDGNGNIVGAVFKIVTKGYNSGLNITVGIGADGTIKGVIIGDNSETQGLGKKAAEPDFYGQFTGKPYDDPFKVVKSSSADNDIQSISGATITSKAVANAVNTAVEFYKQHGGLK